MNSIDPPAPRRPYATAGASHPWNCPRTLLPVPVPHLPLLPLGTRCPGSNPVSCPFEAKDRPRPQGQIGDRFPWYPRPFPRGMSELSDVRAGRGQGRAAAPGSVLRRTLAVTCVTESMRTVGQPPCLRPPGQNATLNRSPLPLQRIAHNQMNPVQHPRRGPDLRRRSASRRACEWANGSGRSGR